MKTFNMVGKLWHWHNFPIVTGICLDQNKNTLQCISHLILDKSLATCLLCRRTGLNHLTCITCIFSPWFFTLHILNLYIFPLHIFTLTFILAFTLCQFNSFSFTIFCVLWLICLCDPFVPAFLLCFWCWHISGDFWISVFINILNFDPRNWLFPFIPSPRGRQDILNCKISIILVVSKGVCFPVM